MTELELAFVGEVLLACEGNPRRSAEILRREGFSDLELALGRMMIAARSRPPTHDTSA